MNGKNLIMFFFIATFSVQSAEKSETYQDAKALATGISQDYSGNLQRAKDLVTKMQTNPEQAAILKKDAVYLETLAKNAFQKIKKTFENDENAFKQVRDRIQSLRQYETYQGWLKVQDEKLAQLHNDIGTAVPACDRGFSEPMSPTSPRSVSTSSGSPLSSPSSRVSPRPMSPSVVSPSSAAVMSPGRRRGATGEGAQGIGRKYVGSGTATPKAGVQPERKIFGGTGMPPKQ